MAIKADGKVLREFTDSVYLPFGSEYSIFLKNLSKQKARVHVTIDGSDVLDGKSLIIDGHSSFELKRFIKNGNLLSGNSFKFIEKTAAVEKHRGNRAEDGLVTIKFEFEVADWTNRLGGSLQPIMPYRPSIPNTPYREYYGDRYDPNVVWCAINGSNTMDSNHQSKAMQQAYVQTLADSTRAAKCPQPIATAATPINTAGVTAPGSVNDQKFSVAGHFFGSGVHHVMSLQLQGKVSTWVPKMPASLKGEGVQVKFASTPVTQEVVVKTHKKCSMCGTKVKQVAKFCHECGSSVNIV